MGKQTLSQFQTKLLHFKRVGLDSMIFLYHFADYPPYAPMTEVVFSLAEKRKIEIITSTVSVAEIFVHVEEKQDQMIMSHYETFFNILPNFQIIPIDWHVARLAAKLRASYKKQRLPDLLQVSATLLNKYPCFLTNDKRLKSINELEVMVLDDFI